MAGQSAGFRHFIQGAKNALELLRGGRFSAPYRAPFELVDETPIARLRRYPGTRTDSARPILLVPPLMVTAEVYDISAELSAVTWLANQGLDVWLIDFGAPEEQQGGMQRTLDDHVLAVDRAIGKIHEITGHDIHLAGYSQGGMFVYQAAAYRRGEGLASLITFGSPVNIHRNVGTVYDGFVERLVVSAREALNKPLEYIDGLPGIITSTGFRVFSARKELQQMVELLSILHDRDALERRELRRRFIAGEGFVAWPGPAFRTFFDEFIVANRMVDGGFVIDGKTVTLADIQLPILSFVGLGDEIARPAAVRAIASAAPEAQVYEVGVPAGHFGLVVGSRSLGITWPTVAEWCRWHDGQGEMPTRLQQEAPANLNAELEGDEAFFEDMEIGISFLYDLMTEAAERVVGRLNDASDSMFNALDVMRWHLPRVARIRRLDDDTPWSMALMLSEQARAIGEETFFLSGGRAFTYAQSDERVTNVAKGLWMIGVRPHDRVAVVMSNRPTYLSLVAALSRIRAVAVLIPNDLEPDLMRRAFEKTAPQFTVSDPDSASRVAKASGSKPHVLGGGTKRRVAKSYVDMEALDVASFSFGADVPLNGGLGGDPALVIVESTPQGGLEVREVSNRRWAMTSLGMAAGCRLTTSDTVYSCLPLHNQDVMLLAVGGALSGGARLALAPAHRGEEFWAEVRRSGSSVVFVDGELAHDLVSRPPKSSEAANPVRIFVGTEIPARDWARLEARFQPDRVVCFHISTQAEVVLVNVSGLKAGSVGKPLPGVGEVALVQAAEGGTSIVRNVLGRAIACTTGEPGVLLARAQPGGRRTVTALPVEQDVFERGDAWLNTQDLFRMDEDGDYWPIKEKEEDA